MNTKKFSEAMGEINGRYIEEAISYRPKAKTTPHAPRWSVAVLAAILTTLLIGAGVAAIRYGDSIQNWFHHSWEAITGRQMSEEQAAIIDHLSQELELSQEVGGVTVSVDSATVGYDNFFLLLRVDGLRLSDRSGMDMALSMSEWTLSLTLCRGGTESEATACSITAVMATGRLYCLWNIAMQAAPVIPGTPDQSKLP